MPLFDGVPTAIIIISFSGKLISEINWAENLFLCKTDWSIFFNFNSYIGGIPLLIELTISISISKEEPYPTKMIVGKINSESIEDAIVKLDITMPGELDALIDYSIIRAALNKAHYLVSINKIILEQPRSRMGDIDHTDKNPIKALELYFKSRELSEDKIKILLQHATQIINHHDHKPNQ